MDTNFPPTEIDEEVRRKGFCVYDYLSLSELLGTVQRDYLSIMSASNGPLLGVSLFVAYVSTRSNNLLLFMLFLLTCYGGICALLFFKLLSRTSKFLRIRNVVFGTKSLLIGDRILAYSDAEALERELLIYEKHFEEYLTRPSRMSEVLAREKVRLIEQTVKLFKSSSRWVDDARTAGPFLLVFTLHSIFLYIFYYLGFLLGFLFFGLYALVLQIYLFFVESTERRIKMLVQWIDADLDHLELVESVLERKIEEFAAGSISNIAHFMGEKFNTFYGTIDRILRRESRLKTVIEETDFPEFFSFKIFRAYVRDRYDRPVSHLIGLLEKQHEGIQAQKREIEKIVSRPDAAKDSSLSGNLQLRVTLLGRMEEEILRNLEKLRSMRLRSAGDRPDQ